MTSHLANALRFFGIQPKPSLAERLAAIDWPALRWTYLQSWVGEPCEIAPGCDIHEETWQAVDDPSTGRQRLIEGVDGLYGKTHQVHVWCIARDDSLHPFAATEVSNGVFIVFVPEAITSSSSDA